MLQISETPIFILCGGKGTRLREETELRPKPMVPIGNHPILLHIMHVYARFGFKRFVLCLGYKAEMIKSYFLQYSSMNSDFTVRLKTDEVTVTSIDHDQDWEVTLASTGEQAMTGSRVAKAAAKYLGDVEHFGVTYGDGLTNANLRDEFEFHCSHGRLGTVLGVNPPSRFGELKIDGHSVVEFDEKPDFVDKWINGGYFFFKRGFLRYLSQGDACVLERTPLVKLARDDELRVHKHDGFWACLDTQRDREYLDSVWARGDAPWTLTRDSEESVTEAERG